MSGERWGDVQDDDDDDQSPQNGSPFAERQNLLPRHQHVCQPSTWHQSHSPIAMEWSCCPCSPSTHHFQSSPIWLPRHGDEFSHWAQGSYRCHDQGSSSNFTFAVSTTPRSCQVICPMNGRLLLWWLCRFSFALCCAVLTRFRSLLTRLCYILSYDWTHCICLVLP